MQFIAAKALGCSQDTVARYIARYERVRQAAQQERGEMIDLAELKLWQAIQRGEAWGITLALKTLGRDRGYVESVDVTILIRQQAEALAATYDLDADAIIAEAQALALVRKAG